MNPADALAALGLAFGVLSTAVGAIVWLVRLEGKVQAAEAKADAASRALDGRVSGLESANASRQAERDELIRLETRVEAIGEAIGRLENLVAAALHNRAAPAPRPRTRS